MPQSASGANSAVKMAKVEPMSGEACCGDSNCASNSIVALAGQQLCLEHFMVKCYERLDWVESIARTRRLEINVAERARVLLQECANQTLLICLRHEPLDKIERSRLLEILLQCGDLQVALRRPIMQLS